jgi:hypothetical protein
MVARARGSVKLGRASWTPRPSRKMIFRRAADEKKGYRRTGQDKTGTAGRQIVMEKSFG